MNRGRPLREEMSAAAIRLPILRAGARLNSHLRAQALAIAARADENDFKPVVPIVRTVVKEGLRAHFEIRVLLTIGHKKIEESIAIVISPGCSAPAAQHFVGDTGRGGDVSKSSVAIVMVKVIRTFTQRVAPGVNNI